MKYLMMLFLKMYSLISHDTTIDVCLFKVLSSDTCGHIQHVYIVRNGWYVYDENNNLII